MKHGYWIGTFVLVVGAMCGEFVQAQKPQKSTPAEVDVRFKAGFDYLSKDLYSQAAAEFQRVTVLNPKSAVAYYNLGFSYWKLRKIDLAAAAFRKAVALQPNDRNSHYYLGRIHLLKGETDRAIEIFEKLVRNGTSPVADEFSQLGQAYLKNGQTDKAINFLKNAVEQQPQEAGLHDALAKAYQEQGRQSEADEEFRRSTELREKDLRASQLIQQIRQRLEKKEINEALRLSVQVMSLDDLEYLIALGTLLGRAGLQEEALRSFEKACTLNPRSFEAHYNLAYTKVAQGKYEIAEKHLEQAVSLQPDSFEAQSLLGAVRSNLNKNLPAIESLRKAAELRPDNQRVLSVLGLQYIQGKFYEEATQTLKKALSLDESDLTIRFLLIQAYYKNHATEKALDLAKQTAKQFPEVARAHYELGFQLVTIGRFQESKAPLEKALQLEPGYPEALYLMGDMALKEDKVEEAIRFFREALKGNSTYTDAYSGLGRALLESKRYEEVLTEMKSATQIDREEPQFHLHLAQAFRALGQQENAQYELKEFDRLNRIRMKKKDEEGIRKYPKP